MIDDDDGEVFNERPWLGLKTTYDVETWIDHQNRLLQRHASTARPERCGMHFVLAEGGGVYLHTMQEGDVVLDVPEEAEWIVPLLEAVGCTRPASSTRWALPGERLTQLVMALSPLLASTALVSDHDFGRSRW